MILTPEIEAMKKRCIMNTTPEQIFAAVFAQAYLNGGGVNAAAHHAALAAIRLKRLDK